MKADSSRCFCGVFLTAPSSLTKRRPGITLLKNLGIPLRDAGGARLFFSYLHFLVLSGLFGVMIGCSRLFLLHSVFFFPFHKTVFTERAK